MTKVIKMQHNPERMEITSLVLQDSELTFNYFNGLPEDKREEQLRKAIYIGVLALMEDRFSAFLARTKNELGTELESLKLLFDMKKELFLKSTGKGKIGEHDIYEYLSGFLQDKGMSDTVSLTGDKAGALPRNKTGDILCEIAESNGKRIAIECKFDKSVDLGKATAVDITKNRKDTAWSQLLEAQVNREADISLIVFDKGTVSGSVSDACEGVRFLPDAGFIVLVDYQKGDYTNLAVAYLLARDIALHAKPLEMDKDVLAALVNRLVAEMTDFLKIRKLVESNIENNREILRKMEKGLLVVQFTAEYLAQFLQSGALNRKDLLAFTQMEEVRARYKAIEGELGKI